MINILFAVLLFYSSSTLADEWRTGDTYREVAFQTLNIIDWGQTRYIAEHPESFHEVEAEWAIGKHPTTGRVDSYMAQTAALHLVIAFLLPSNWRTTFQYITIGDKLNATIGNTSLGIKILF